MTPTPDTTRVPSGAPRRRARRRPLHLFRYYDDPPGVDSHALPSEIALRPIEPHYPMHR